MSLQEETGENSCWSSGNTEMQSKSCFICMVASSVWWPGVSQQIAQTLQQYAECAKNSIPNKEPVMILQLPEYPWQVVGTDLFEVDGVHYLLIVDYFSRYPEVIQLITLRLLQWSEHPNLCSLDIKLFEVIMVTNIHRRNLRSLQTDMSLTTLQSVQDFHKAMVKSSGPFKQ